MTDVHTSIFVFVCLWVFSPLTGLKKLKKESLGTCLVTVRTVPRPLCFCFFLIVFTVTSFPLCQSIWQLEKGGVRRSERRQKKLKVRKCQEEADMWDVQAREINIERVSRRFYQSHNMSKPQFIKNVCMLWHSPFTVNDLWTLKWEGLQSIRLWLHLVDFSENCIVEITIGLKVELQRETLNEKGNNSSLLHVKW